MNMNTHVRCLGRGHMKMSDEEFEKERDDMKEKISVLMELLQGSNKE